MGPVSEDFHAAFGLGQDDQHIAPNDLAGVAIAAAKGLYQQLLEKDTRLENQHREIESLRAELKAVRQNLAVIQEMLGLSRESSKSKVD